MINHELTMAPDDAVQTMHDMALITPETFDRFLIAVLAWYEEEASYRNDIPPNIYVLFEDSEPYNKIFFDIFVESLANRQSHDGQVDSFTAEQRHYYSQMFRDNLNTLYQLMIYDYERLLRELNLVYTWSNIDYGGEELLIKNQTLYEVW